MRSHNASHNPITAFEKWAFTFRFEAGKKGENRDRKVAGKNVKSRDTLLKSCKNTQPVGLQSIQRLNAPSPAQKSMLTSA